jgi:2,4-dienoyl-CoA reductase (NADPH2)
MQFENRGAVNIPRPDKPVRKVYLLKRSKGKHGQGLGKTTGWIHRSSLKMKEVERLSNVTYRKIDDAGLHVEVLGKELLFEVDNIIVCAGQISDSSLAKELKELGVDCHIIGGAEEARELDAKKAINQAAYLAAQL